MARTSRWLCAALALSAATACGGAGSVKLLGTPVHRPVALVFRATPEVAAHSDPRALQAFGQSLIAGLKEKGLVGYLALPAENPPAPRLEFMIRRWDALGGNRLGTGSVSPGVAAVGLVDPPLAVLGQTALGVGILVNARDVQVECVVFREGDTTPADRYVFVNDSGRSVASEIMTRVFTDKRRIERPVVRGGHGGA